MKVKANGIDINYQIDGPDGAPWIVFSNSLATSTAMWDEQAAGLKDSFRVLRYDQRGHGGTDVPAGRYAFDTLLADALGLMDALSIKKAHFAGLSMGGATALGLAERHPDRFDRIIVCNSPCQSTPQSQPAMGRAHRRGAEEGHRSAGRADGVALVSGRDRGKEPAASRQGARHVPRHAGQRLHRLRRGARRPRLRLRHRHGEAAGAVSRAARRTRPRRPCASCTKSSAARAMSSFPAPGIFPTWTGRRSSPKRSAISSPPADQPRCH